MTSQAQPLSFGQAAPAQPSAFNFSSAATPAPSFGFGGTATTAQPTSFGFGQPTNPTSQAPSLFGNTGFGGFGATSTAPAFGQTTSFTGKFLQH